LTISISLWGTIFGSLVGGRAADKVRPRNLIAWCAILYAVATFGITLPLSDEWICLLVMRFLCGTAIGGFTVGCPLYLSEVAPIGQRGRVVSMFQLQVGAGVLVAFCIGSAVAHLVPVDMAWRWCLGMGSVPAIVLLFLLRLKTLEPIRVSVRDIPTEAHHVIHLGDAVRPLKRERLFQRRNTRPILLATSIAIFNQLSGVNILLLYMLDILASAGIGLFLGHTYSVLISCLSLLTTTLGMAFVDKLGRKPLLFIGAAGMALCLIGLGLAIPRHLAALWYLSIFAVYNAFFAFSQGTVVWVYLSELFPPGIRGAGQGYGSSVHWIANALLVLVYPIMQHASSVRTFYLFALMMALQIAVIWLWYPETRDTVLGAVASVQGRERSG
jgi:MFS family permease